MLHDELFADLQLSLQHHSLRCQFFAETLVLLAIGLQQINLDLLEHLFGDNVIELGLFQNQLVKFESQLVVLDAQRIKFACHGVELSLSVFGVLDSGCEISLLL